jgi:F0F1-type ATP synthase membrane subunit b/b'
MTTDTSTTESGTTERAQQTASTAADEGRHVAGVAAGEVQSVAAEAGQQVRSVVDDAMQQAKGQLDDQSRQQKDRLAGTLATFGDDLSRMSETGSGLVADVAAEVGDRARSLSRQLDQREPSELMDDVRRFARQRPGTFLLGAVAAGVVVGRLLRGAKDAVEAAEAQDLDTPPTATGYSSPPLGTGLPS